MSGPTRCKNCGEVLRFTAYHVWVHKATDLAYCKGMTKRGDPRAEPR